MFCTVVTSKGSVAHTDRSIIYHSEKGKLVSVVVCAAAQTPFFLFLKMYFFFYTNTRPVLDLHRVLLLPATWFPLAHGLLFLDLLHCMYME